MRARVLGVPTLLAWLATTACNNPLGRQYEYEEQLYLSVDGSATIVVDASLPAFVALRDLALDPAPRAMTDRDQVRRLLEQAGCRVVRVGQAWRRDGRRFIQVRIDTDDVRTLGACGLFAWSTYGFEWSDGGLDYRQMVGAPASGKPGDVNWDGNELVAFKLHLPSRVTYYNARRLDDGRPADLERGNIVTWEQRLADRRAGVPVKLEVKMEAQSILYRTLWLFAGAFLAAVGVLVAIIWWTMRKGRRPRAAGRAVVRARLAGLRQS